MEQKSESKCKRCQQLLPRAQFFLDSKGYLKGAVCRGCAPARRRELYLKRGGYEAEFRSKKRYWAKHPWVKTLLYIQRRLRNPKRTYYFGMKNELTAETLKELWFRDNAENMLVPSIDRIDPDGHYTFDNCRYLELAENTALARRASPENIFLI